MNVNFVETDEASTTIVVSTPISVTPFSVKPEDITIRLWTHQNPNITQNFIKGYLVKYINEQMIPSYGKFVIDWLKQAKFDFDPSNSDQFSTGQAGSQTVTIHIGKNATKDRFVDYLSAETVKSYNHWMQVDPHAFNQMVNDNFSNNRWIRVTVDGVDFHGLIINNTGLKLGEG